MIPAQPPIGNLRFRLSSRRQEALESVVITWEK